MGEFLGAVLTSIFQSMATMLGKSLSDKINSDKRLALIGKIVFAIVFIIGALAMWQNGQNR